MNESSASLNHSFSSMSIASRWSHWRLLHHLLFHSTGLDPIELDFGFHLTNAFVHTFCQKVIEVNVVIHFLFQSENLNLQWKWSLFRSSRTRFSLSLQSTDQLMGLFETSFLTLGSFVQLVGQLLDLVTSIEQFVVLELHLKI